MIRVLPGDCRDVLRTLADNSVDAIVTDPPYELGFMGRGWDRTGIANDLAMWAETLRVLKPGGHVLAFGGTRTYHRLACAIEDAGFEIRDQIGWAFGSGFPKSHDVSKGIDRAAGAEREVLRQGEPVKRMIPGADQNKAGWEKTNGRIYVPNDTAPATPEALRWQGWGTALKPAHEPIVLARKPLSEGTVAANVLRWGTGAINVDGCRVGTGDLITNHARGSSAAISKGIYGDSSAQETHQTAGQSLGRWPANLIHDGSDEVVGCFPESAGAQGQVNRQSPHTSNSRGDFAGIEREFPFHNDSGSAARFFYSAKADSDDRLGSSHPTVKPVDLMQYLVRLVTPRGGLVLDPFAGTGTTGEAAHREGCRAILIERDPDSLADIERRLALMRESPASRRTASLKARGKIEAPGPLFEVLP